MTTYPFTVTTDDGWQAMVGEDGTVTITDPDRHVAGAGRWDGRIEDCAADIGEGVYDALDDAIREAMM